MDKILDDEHPELIVSVNDDPHMYYNNVGKPLKRIAVAILLMVVLSLGGVFALFLMGR